MENTNALLGVKSSDDSQTTQSNMMKIHADLNANPLYVRDVKKGIIFSLLDTDLYKLTMMQAYFHRFNKQHPLARFKFHNRTTAVSLAKHVDEINHQLDLLCQLTFQKDEIDYLKSLGHFKQGFLDFLSRFQLKREYIKCYVNSKGELVIEAEGPIVEVTLFEIYVLSIVQEVYTNSEYPNMDYSEGERRLTNKINFAKDKSKYIRALIMEMGTRRRFNYQWHHKVVETLAHDMPKDVFIGTSNVLFAKEFNLKCFGTMAHEYLQLGQAIAPRLIDSVKFMLEEWLQEYRGQLAIALSDVVGFDAFLKDFDRYFASAYDGARHDSGNPYKWCERLIEHYESFSINPMTKSAVFSDGLTFETAFEIADYFRGRIRTIFGIGTNISNDLGVKALQLVMKLTWVCIDDVWLPVAKISDSSGKGMCEDPLHEQYLKHIYNIKD